jgi:hypothetical protein
MCFLVVFGITAFALNAVESFVIAERGKRASCAIAVVADASEAEKYAAKELQTFVRRMTGVELPVLTGAAAVKRKRAVVLSVDASVVRHPDAFRLTVDGDRLLITGGGGRGVLYGVYELLERFGGCDWFAPWCEKVPELDSFEVPLNLDFADKPAFDGRYTSWRHTFRERENLEFSSRLRYNGRHTKKEHGSPAVVYAISASDGAIGKLVPPEKYFEQHPQWYCEIDGKRRAKGAWQICYSNNELVKFVAERVKERLRSVPGANATSIAQNDCAGWCRCAECKACADEEGSQSGPNIKFANAVAEEVEKEFPDALIVTFAYQHTRRAPKKIKPRRNVMVVLCSFECSFFESFERSRHPNTMKFCEDLRSWGAICRNLRIYDYCVNFSNYLHPFPNINSLAPNYRLFRDCGTRWLGSQGGGDGYHAEFAELKAYLMAKLMWNPDQPVAPIIKRFLDGYYGAAAPFVEEYICRLYKEYARTRNPETGIGIYSEQVPLQDSVSDDLLGLWRRAVSAVNGDPERCYNTKMGMLPLVYTKLKGQYERLYKSVWVTSEPEKHIAGVESLKPVAKELVMLCDEAKSRRRNVALAENYRNRHLVLMKNFRELEKWTPPLNSGITAEVSTNSLMYYERFGWQLPIRLIACDADAKYRVRARLRRKAEVKTFGTKDGYAFACGLMVRWLPKSPGSVRTEIPRGNVNDQWSWHDVGEFDFASLQRIPPATHDGLCLFVQGDVELDKLEISRINMKKRLRSSKK